MQESEEIPDAGRRLFGTLFGFKKGDRVKIRKRIWSYWRSQRKHYWRYGTVREVRLDTWDYVPRYKVLLDGDFYSSTFKGEELIKVRKYAKKRV